MLTVAELNAIRDRVRKQLSIREPHHRLIIGVGTVGIAAGAREVMVTAMEEVGRRGLDLVVIGEDLAMPASDMPVVKFVSANGEEKVYTKVTAAEVCEIIDSLADTVGKLPGA
ncbi:MAG: (2Fe-2S) ferredoxin domain-containing protein [Firmicutes bacterium]|nr:(2Fe-2S) ferredoxin domain-containing protein [Bacillota bacterium]